MTEATVETQVELGYISAVTGSALGQVRTGAMITVIKTCSSVPLGIGLFEDRLEKL